MRVGTEMGSELDFGVVFGMGECTEFHIDGVCSEFEFGSFLEMSVRDCVPLQMARQAVGKEVQETIKLQLHFQLGWKQKKERDCYKKKIK